MFSWVICLFLALSPFSPAPATGNLAGRRPQNEAEMRFWLENALRYHRQSLEEVQEATGMTAEEIQKERNRLKIPISSRPRRDKEGRLAILPYPGGRHPRQGAQAEAPNPQRDTQFSLFPPWDDDGVIVLDLPEAFRVDKELLYQSHSGSPPSIWQAQGVVLPPQEWKRLDNGVLMMERKLPNEIVFGARIVPTAQAVLMEVWVTNGTKQALKNITFQNTLYLRGSKDFREPTNDNKTHASPYVVVRSGNSKRWLIMGWDKCDRLWGVADIPSANSDPRIQVCPPGETRRVYGWLSFYEGSDLTAELERITQTGWQDGKGFPNRP